MKRTILFVVTNLAVMFAMTVAFHVLCALLGTDPNAAFRGSGLDLASLAVFSLVFGMGGAVLSLLLSKTIAKVSVGARADAGSAHLLGSPSPMIAALRRLDNLRPGILPDSLKAMGISGTRASLFATHPSIEDRVAALERLQRGI